LCDKEGIVVEGIMPGLASECQLLVKEENTAAHLGSGDVSALATPEMIRLMEKASVAAVDPLLPEGYKTVGILVNVRHLAATPMGMKVRVRAELVEVDGRRLVFRVEAHDEVEKVGEGEHHRMIIDVKRFKERMSGKGESASVSLASRT
jgi:predicted thioesterase